MALRPKLKDVPKIRGALRWYRITAYVTGIMLLLLVLEMILKYTGIHREIDFGGRNGFIALVPWDPTGLRSQISGLNVSTGILIAHGWLYVVYLFCNFRLWSFMRWPFSRFIAIALGGVIPFLSFIVEHFITRRAKREIAELLAQPVAAKPAASPAASVPASSTPDTPQSATSVPTSQAPTTPASATEATNR